MKHAILIILAISAASFCFAEDWLTIYNDDLSLVRTSFELQLDEGRQSYNFDDITSRIEPASVIVTSPNKGFTIAEQNYEYDLAGTYQIMMKYLNRNVTVLTEDRQLYEGTLKFLDNDNIGMIDENSQRLVLVAYSKIQSIRLAELPANFYTKPTLHWELIANSKAKYPLMLSYLSGGFSWNVTYNT
ncbi:MAG: DUF4139 domain-containing protein, partial [Candidatus Cloacimonetes bacterium]|nr:DUF4139 domain-containing protein [Candidatus Cloacimonadota bacterium]